MTNSAPIRAGRREWIGLSVLALPTLLLSLDLSVLYLALPQLSEDLQPSSTQMLWIMDIYGFMIAGFLVTMGTLGDRIGRRKLLMIGGSAFAIASVIAAFSTSAGMLIAARALLGIAGATLMPSTLALISNMFAEPRQRTTAFGVWMASFTVGMAIGPVVGGLLLETFWWGSVFLMGVPVMAILLATAPFLLPEYRDPRAGRIDLISVALSLAAILPIVYGIKDLAKSGLETTPILAMVAGAAFGLAFVQRQRGMTAPLLDLALFGRGRFRTALGVMLLCTMIVGATLLFVTQYLQMVEGLSPLRSGLWLVPFAVATTVSSMLTPVITRWLRPGMFLGICYLIAAAGFLLLTQVSSGGLPFLVTGLVIVAISMAPVGVLVTDLVVGSAPPERAGSASSLSETSAEFGNALGVAVLGSVGTAIYRARIADSIPEGVPAAIASPTRDTLAGATNAANELPGPLGAALLDASREAFTSGMSTVAAISAVAAIAIAVLAFTRIHDGVPPESDVDIDEAGLELHRTMSVQASD